MDTRMKLLIVEDEPRIGQYLQQGLSEAGFAVDLTADGDEGLQLALAGEHDLLILDVMLPGRDGWQILQALRQTGSAVPVLFLTARDAVEDRVRGLELGADDYLVKPFEIRELVARIKVLVRRQMPGKANDIACGDLRYDLRTRQFALAGEELALPPRERTLLETLMLKAGSTVSKQALIDAIFGLDDEPSADAVDIYIHRLRKKLEASQATIITLRGVGYLLRTRQEE